MPLKPLLLILTRFKIRTYLGTLILSAMILMPEDTLHFVAVFLHTVYESIAYALEHMLMHNLGATKFQAQMAVFYLSLAIGLVAGYLIIRRFPRWLASLRQLAIAEAQCLVNGLTNKWHNLPNRRKLELLTLNAIGLASGIVFLLS